MVKMSRFDADLKKLEHRLSDCAGPERRALQAQLRRIQKNIRSGMGEKKAAERLLRLNTRMTASAERRKRRRAARPVPTYAPDLPITARKDEIIAGIQKHPVLIISGETGSGKTTQIPKFCLAAGRGIDGMIGCTQPRRIAAVTVAGRIAEELGDTVGQAVGYKIRFADNVNEDAFVKIMTDGILLAEAQGDRRLTAYDTIIVDEAHERSLNIDFVLGLLKRLLRRRRDLKLVITSATIDTEKFSKAFDDAPVIEVSGRMYPVDVRYRPGGDAAGDPKDLTHVEKAVQAVAAIQQATPFGDILVFMPTEQDIRETCELLGGRGYANAAVMPLFARLSAGEQSRVFKRVAGRKIIVATNVAETSLTIPGIRYVVDTGLARISRYTPRTRTTALPVVPVSRSSADQRKGRCGRVANGVCIRLYSEEEYNDRDQYTLPEILRSNLAEVILRMMSLKLGDINEFPFIDRPSPRSIKDGFDLLMELGAIQKAARPDGRHRKKSGAGPRDGSNGFVLTGKGRMMARLPIDPRLSRMLIQAHAEGCTPSVTVIAAALSIQDPRERPAEKAGLADQAHAVFRDPWSDFVTLLNIWQGYQAAVRAGQKTGQIARQLKDFCRTHFLSFKRMREWRDIHDQISAILRENKLTGRHAETGSGARGTVAGDGFGSLYKAVHTSVLSGFSSNIAVKKENHLYQGTKGRQPMIFPGSGLFKNAGDWIVAAEMMETSRLFARTVARIDSAWLEAVAGDQCRRIYLEPRWERKRGEVVADEQVSLYGLVIIPRRPVSYGRIDPEKASQIFIRSALVEGDMRQLPDFMVHNRRLIDGITDMENRIRRRDILVSEEDIYLFYQERLPGVYDQRTLNKRIKGKGGGDFLKMSRAFLCRQLPDEKELGRFPDRLPMGNRHLACEYCFDPGHERDGVTLKVPDGLAQAVPADALDWVVPGLLKEKIETLVKGLPKVYRKQLVPVGRTADTIAREMPRTGSSLITALGEFIYRRFGVDIPAREWPEDAIPAHLKMRIALIDARGKQVRAGRDTSILSQGVQGSLDNDLLQEARQQWEKTGLKQWNFGDLPESVTIGRASRDRREVWPGLEKSEEAVNLKLFQNRAGMLASHQQGVGRLYTLHFAKDLKFLKKSLCLTGPQKEQARCLGGADKIGRQVYARIVRELFHQNIRRQDDFEAHARSVAPRILKKGLAMMAVLAPVLEAVHDARLLLGRLETAHRFKPVALKRTEKARRDLARLVPETFIDLYAVERLTHLPRYVRAIAEGTRRALVNPEKDRIREERIAPFNHHLDEMLKTLSPRSSDARRSAIESFFWLLEEYKVSIFAQEIGTAVPVSEKRLEKMIGEIRRMV